MYICICVCILFIAIASNGTPTCIKAGRAPEIDMVTSLSQPAAFAAASVIVRARAERGKGRGRSLCVCAEGVAAVGQASPTDRQLSPHDRVLYTCGLVI